MRPRPEMKLGTRYLILVFHLGHCPMLATSWSAPKVADCELWLRCRGLFSWTSKEVLGQLAATDRSAQRLTADHICTRQLADKRRNKQRHTAALRRPRTITAHGGAPQPQTAQRSLQTRIATESHGSNQMPNAATDFYGSSRTPCSKCSS